MIKFGFGQSPFPPFAPAIEALKTHAARKDYAPVQGLPELREAIATFHRKVDEIDIHAENILVAPGSKILIYAVMAAFTDADVLIPAPAWVSYAPQAALLGHNAIRLETNFEKKWRITADDIEQAARAKADPNQPSVLILNYPGNPEGLTYSAAELEALAVALRKHNVLVVSDEIYGLLHHAGEHISLARSYPEGTIITTGLSKWCGAGGWRLGAALLPEALSGAFKETMLGIASETYSCATTPVQLAAIEAYQWSTELGQYIQGQRDVMKFVGNWLATQLQEAGIKVHSPEGGFYLFLDFTPFQDALHARGIITSQQLCGALLAETGVAILPGDAFGITPEHLTARLAYVTFDGAEALALAAKGTIQETSLDGVFIEVKQGAQKIASWIKQ